MMEDPESWLTFLKRLFVSADFMPRGHCYLWRPQIVWLHVLSDLGITLAYYAIPVMLLYVVRKRRDLAFHWMFIMFGLFILLCGTTHLMAIWTLWHPVYRLDGAIKLLTALVSLASAVLLWLLIPKALALPSPKQLEESNAGLQREIAQRRRIEEALVEKRREIEGANSHLLTTHRELEETVRQRTQELEMTKEQLEFKVAQRTDELQLAKETLEEQVAQLELLNRVMMGREERILELKEALRVLRGNTSPTPP